MIAEFVSYSDLQSPAVHAVQCIDWDIDAWKIGDFDYFEQEARGAEIVLDSSDWLKQHLFVFPDTLAISTLAGQSDAVYVWEYAVRLRNSLSGEVEYTGYVTGNSGYEPDVVKQQVTINLVDFIGVSDLLKAKQHQIICETEYSVQDVLSMALQYLQNALSLPEIGQNYDLVVSNYVTDLQLLTHEFANWANPNSTSGGTMPLERQIQAFWMENGHIHLVLMKYWKRADVYGGSTTLQWYIHEGIKLRHVIISDTIEIYTQNTIAKYSDTLSTSVDAEPLFVANYPATYPTGNVMNFATNAGAYSIEDEAVTFTGYALINTIAWQKPSDDESTLWLSQDELLKMMLMLNNLAIKVSKTGMVSVVNKDLYDDTLPVMQLEDDDIYEQSEKPLLKSKADYEGIFKNLVDGKAYSGAVKNHYGSLFVICNREHSITLKSGPLPAVWQRIMFKDSKDEIVRAVVYSVDPKDEGARIKAWKAEFSVGRAITVYDDPEDTTVYPRQPGQYLQLGDYLLPQASSCSTQSIKLDDNEWVAVMVPDYATGVCMHCGYKLRLSEDAEDYTEDYTIDWSVLDATIEYLYVQRVADTPSIVSILWQLGEREV